MAEAAQQHLERAENIGPRKAVRALIETIENMPSDLTHEQMFVVSMECHYGMKWDLMVYIQ